jgi:hypothetical protein
MNIHPGITIHKIPAEGVGGLIFALGLSALVLTGIPAFVPLFVACVLGGLALALLLHQIAPLPPTQMAGAVPVFLLGLALALSVAPVYGLLVAASLPVAYLMNRATLSRRPVSIRTL